MNPLALTLSCCSGKEAISGKYDYKNHTTPKPILAKMVPKIPIHKVS
jgi:hypothetical protein